MTRYSQEERLQLTIKPAESVAGAHDLQDAMYRQDEAAYDEV